MTEYADADSGEGTFGMTDDLFERSQAMRKGMSVTESFTVQIPDDVDHYLVERGKEDELAAKIARRRFKERHDASARSTLVDRIEDGLRPSDGFRSIWLITCSTEYGGVDEHQTDRWTSYIGGGD